MFEGQKGTTSLEPNGQNSYVYMSSGGNLCAVLVFGDEIKGGASETIRELRGMGYKLFLISGDGNEATRAVAERTGFESSYGGKLPEEKAAYIEKLQSEKMPCRYGRRWDQ